MDTAGLLLRVHVHPADEQDRDAGRDLLVGADQQYPRLQQVWADGGYRGVFEEWVAEHLGWQVTIVSRAPEQRGFVLQARRWVVERTFAWLGRYRRLAKDVEHLAECAEAHILTASIHLLLRRLATTPA